MESLVSEIHLINEMVEKKKERSPQFMVFVSVPSEAQQKAKRKQFFH